EACAVEARIARVTRRAAREEGHRARGTAVVLERAEARIQRAGGGAGQVAVDATGQAAGRAVAQEGVGGARVSGADHVYIRPRRRGVAGSQAVLHCDGANVEANAAAGTGRGVGYDGAMAQRNLGNTRPGFDGAAAGRCHITREGAVFSRERALIAHDRSAELSVVAHERAAAHDGGAVQVPQPAAHRAETEQIHRVPVADGERIERERLTWHDDEDVPRAFSADNNSAREVGRRNGERSVVIGDNERLTGQRNDTAGEIRGEGDGIGAGPDGGVADRLTQGAGAAVGQGGHERRSVHISVAARGHIAGKGVAPGSWDFGVEIEKRAAAALAADAIAAAEGADAPDAVSGEVAGEGAVDNRDGAGSGEDRATESRAAAATAGMG